MYQCAHLSGTVLSVTIYGPCVDGAVFLSNMHLFSGSNFLKWDLCVQFAHTSVISEGCVGT